MFPDHAVCLMRVLPSLFHSLLHDSKHNRSGNRVVHGSHSWAIFSLFSNPLLCIWQRNKWKGMKNDVKNGYCEHPRKEILEKWSKNAFFPSGTLPKRWKMIIFWVYFCKSEVRVPFCINFSFILSFKYEKNGNKMNWKMVEEWLKMDQKCQLWTTLMSGYGWSAFLFPIYSSSVMHLCSYSSSCWVPYFPPMILGFFFICPVPLEEPNCEVYSETSSSVYEQCNSTGSGTPLLNDDGFTGIIFIDLLSSLLLVTHPSLYLYLP